MPLFFGDFELTPGSYVLRRAGAPVHVEPRVFELLAYLVSNRERVVSKQELLDRLWQKQFVSESALSGAVRDARRALGDSGSKSGWIHTVHGRGFRFVGEVREGASLAPSARAPAERAAASLVVLPLEDLSGEAAPAYFADGMTDALITELARRAALRVISRTSAMSYQGTRKPLAAIAAELGVEFVVEGTVLRAGERMRITARLVRASTDENLWAESYEGDLRDVLALQSKAAQAIARGVRGQLASPDDQGLALRRQVEPEVFLLDLEGRHFLAQRREQGFRKGLRCFQAAVNRDPTYAPAFAGLAESYAMLGNYGILAPREAHPPARAAVERALALDPTLAEAHRTAALLHWEFEFDWQAAKAAYRRALELDPNSSQVRYWHAIFHGVQGHFDESLAELERARERDPLSLNVVAVQGWMHYFARRFEQALPYFRHVLEVDPDHLLGRWFLGEALIELRLWEGGTRELETALELSRRSSRFLGYLGYAYGRAGRPQEARALARELEERRTAGYVPAYFVALVHAGLGDVRRALEALERTWAERDTLLRDLLVDPPWELLKDEPRYLELLRHLRLARR